MAQRKWEEEVPCHKVVPASEVAGRGLQALDAPHVLVVEDTDMCAMIICMLLKKLGCSTDHAENGEEALEMLKKAEPGLYSMVCTLPTRPPPLPTRHPQRTRVER
jgi:PleD family two-component response regulator